jgi:hypothetical protein
MKYLQGIRKLENKTAGEMLHDVGNTFCRGYFGECDEEKLY